MDDPGRSSRVGSQSSNPSRAIRRESQNRSLTPKRVGLRPRSTASVSFVSAASVTPSKRVASAADSVSDGLLEHSKSPEHHTPAQKRQRFRPTQPVKHMQFTNLANALQELKETTEEVPSFLETSSVTDAPTPLIPRQRTRQFQRPLPGIRPRSTTETAPNLTKALATMATEDPSNNAAGPSGTKKTDTFFEDDDLDEPETPVHVRRPRAAARKDKRLSVPKPNLLKALAAAKDELAVTRSDSESSATPRATPSKKRGKYRPVRKDAAHTSQLAAAMQEYQNQQESDKLPQEDDGKVNKSRNNDPHLESDDSDDPETPVNIGRPRNVPNRNKRFSVAKPNLQESLAAAKDDLANRLLKSDSDMSDSPISNSSRKRGKYRRVRKDAAHTSQLAAAMQEYQNQQESYKLPQEDDGKVNKSRNIDPQLENDDSDDPDTPVNIGRPRNAPDRNKRLSVAKPNLQKSLAAAKEDLANRSLKSDTDMSDSPTLNSSRKRGRYIPTRKEAVPTSQLASALSEHENQQESDKLQQKDDEKLNKSRKTEPPLENDTSDEPETPVNIGRPRTAPNRDKRFSVPKPHLQKALAAAKDDLMDSLLTSDDYVSSDSPTLGLPRKRGRYVPVHKEALPTGHLAAALAEYRHQQELEKLPPKDDGKVTVEALAPVGNANDSLLYPDSPIPRNSVAREDHGASDSAGLRSSAVKDRNTTRNSVSQRVSAAVDRSRVAKDQPAMENLPSTSAKEKLLDISIPFGPFQAPSQSTPQTSSKLAPRTLSSRPASHMSVISGISTASSTFMSLEDLAEAEEDAGNAVELETEAAHGLMFSNGHTSSSARNVGVDQMVQSVVAALESLSREERESTTPPAASASATKEPKPSESEGTIIKQGTRVRSRSISRSAYADTTGKKQAIALAEELEDVEEDFVIVEKKASFGRTSTTNLAVSSHQSLQAAVPLTSAQNDQSMTRNDATPFVPADYAVAQNLSQDRMEMSTAHIPASKTDQAVEKSVRKSVNKTLGEKEVHQENPVSLTPVGKQPSVTMQSSRRSSQVDNRSLVSKPGGVVNSVGPTNTASPKNISTLSKVPRVSSGRPIAAELSSDSATYASKTTAEAEKETDSESLRSRSILSGTTDDNPELVALFNASDAEEIVETSESDPIAEIPMNATKDDEVRAGNLTKPVPAGLDITQRLGKRISTTNVTMDSILANLDARKPGWASTPMVLASSTRAGKVASAFQPEDSSRAGPSTSGLKVPAQGDKEDVSDIINRLIKKPAPVFQWELGLAKKLHLPTQNVKQTSMKAFLSTLPPQMQKHLNELPSSMGPKIEAPRKFVPPKRAYTARKPRDDDPQPLYVTKGNVAFYSKMASPSGALEDFHTATAVFTDGLIEDLQEFLEYKQISVLRNFEDVFELTLFQGMFKNWREYADFVRCCLPYEVCKALVPFDMDLQTSQTSLNWTVKTQKRIEAMVRQYAEADEEGEEME